MRNAKSYVPGFQIGEPMSGYGIAEVKESKNDAYPVGTIVSGFTGWQEYSVVPGASGLRVLHGARESPIPLSAHLGALGMPVRILRYVQLCLAWKTQMFYAVASFHSY